MNVPQTVAFVLTLAVIVGFLMFLDDIYRPTIKAWWLMRASIQPIGIDSGKIYIVIYDEKWIGEAVIRGLADYLAHMEVEAVFIATGSMGAIAVMPAAREGLVDALAMIEAREEAVSK